MAEAGGDQVIATTGGRGPELDPLDIAIAVILIGVLLSLPLWLP